MPNRFVYRRGVERDVTRLPGLAAAFKARAEAGAAAARRLAHAEAYETGDYERGIEADAGLSNRGEMVGRIVGTDWKSGLIELGSANNPPRAILRRGAEAAGLRVTRSGRQ